MQPTMSKDEMRQALESVRALDNRIGEITEEKLNAWGRVLNTKITHKEFLDLVKLHYKTNRNCVTPADINNLFVPRNNSRIAAQFADLTYKPDVAPEDHADFWRNAIKLIQEGVLKPEELVLPDWVTHKQRETLKGVFDESTRY